jgi:RNA 2',3'-cyclic 3'-phosphodiesterase
MRLFVGIPLGLSVSREIQKTSSSLKWAAGRMRWTEPESWHITLQFLGNATPERLPSLVAHLQEVKAPPLSIQLGGVDFFDRAGVLFVGVVVSQQLAALQKQVSLATAACGFIPDPRSYRPHITLARIKDRTGMKTLRGFLAGEAHPPAISAFEPIEFLLYESFLGRDGARYEIRTRFPLSP